MTDVFSKKTRNKIMSSVKNKDTEIEIIVRKFLFSKGFRYRKNDKRYPGSPDIILPKYKTAIFVNGCFWHGHENCVKSKLPDTNREFWMSKINKNILRDKEAYILLNNLGWKIITVWKCELSGKLNQENRLEKLINEIMG